MHHPTELPSHVHWVFQTHFKDGKRAWRRRDCCKEAEQASGGAGAAPGACMSKHRQYQCCLWCYVCTCGVGDETQSLVQVRQLLYTELYPQHFIVHLKRFIYVYEHFMGMYLYAWSQRHQKKQITELEL